MKGCMDSSMRPFSYAQRMSRRSRKHEGSGQGQTHEKESLTSILFSRAIKTRPPDPFPLKLHARSLWFFIFFR